MAKLLKLRRGTTSQHSSFTGAEGEVTVDTDKETLVVHNGSTAGGFPVMSAAGGTFTGAVTFNSGLTFNDDLDLQDNDKLLLGTGDDLQIYHDGTDSIIDNNTGELKLYASQLTVKSNDGGETQASFTENAAVSLYHNNVKKFETTATSVQVHGHVDVQSAGSVFLQDNGKLQCGTGQDLLIFHDGSNSIIRASGTGALKVEGNNSASMILSATQGEKGVAINHNGSVELYHDNNLKIQTESGGAKVTGDLKLADDSNKIKLGAGDDLQLFHDGSNSWIDDAGTGALKVRSQAGGVQILGTGSNENMAVFTVDGGVELYHDNSKKFHTHSTGGTVSGYLHFADGSPTTSGIGLGNSDDLKLYHDGTNSALVNTTGNLNIASQTLRFNNTNMGHTYIACDVSSDVELYYDNSKKFNTESTGAQVHGNLRLDDNHKFQCGNSQDLQIYHNGSNSIINDSGTGNLELVTNGTKVTFQGGSDTMANFIKDGAVELYHNDGLRLSTTSSGVDVTGGISNTGNIDMDTDSGKLRLGDGQEFEIFHDGSDSYISNTSAHDLIIRNTGNAGILIQSQNSYDVELKTNAENAVACRANASVELYYNNAKKVETRSTGFHVEANNDIRFANGTWTGDTAGKIQHHSNMLYIQGGSGGIVLRDDGGSDRWAVSSDGHWFPQTNNTYDIGTSSYRVRNLYVNDAHFSNEGSTNSVDGTWGDWTLQEGEDDIFMLNNRTGKKYKMALQEVG